MNSGKQLDAMIHTKVMNGRNLLKIPPYSTDLLSAWMIVERLKNKKWRVTIEEWPEGWAVNFYKDIAIRASDGSCVEVRAAYMPSDMEYAVSAPHAICVASLATSERRRNGR